MALKKILLKIKKVAYEEGIGNEHTLSSSTSLGVKLEWQNFYWKGTIYSCQIPILNSIKDVDFTVQGL